jgi:glucosamine 6-phosphate synthetase-like amidotransferase/phosphosugar isomerase protein
MAKWHEALTRPCHTSELEEWAHEEYFITDERTDTFILLPPGGGHSRGLEQAAAAKEMGSRVILIAAAGDEEAQKLADVYFAMPSDIPEPLTPFVYKAPFEHLSCQIAHEQKIPFLGFNNPKRQQVNFRQIFGSAQAADAR